MRARSARSQCAISQCALPCARVWASCVAAGQVLSQRPQQSTAVYSAASAYLNSSGVVAVKLHVLVSILRKESWARAIRKVLISGTPSFDSMDLSIDM